MREPASRAVRSGYVSSVKQSRSPSTLARRFGGRDRARSRAPVLAFCLDIRQWRRPKRDSQLVRSLGESSSSVPSNRSTTNSLGMKLVSRTTGMPERIQFAN